MLISRKSTRLKNFDYSQNGSYFLTLCAKDKQRIFGDIVGGGAFDAPQVKLSPIGLIAEKYILSSNNIKDISVDKYVIMPNHIHLIVTVKNQGGTSRAPSPTSAKIPLFVSTLKRFCNKEIGFNAFQRSFFDHIIRDEQDYNTRWNYIDTNPAKWETDDFYF